MTKRFYLLSNEEDAIIFKNGFGLSQQKVCDLLNELNDENQRLLSANTKLTNENTAILNTIRTTYQNERTSIGRNTLKQLIEALE